MSTSGSSFGARALEYAQVDVFAERPLEGNMLGIFADGRGLSDGEMQALARETNLSETTFVLPRAEPVERECGVRVRDLYGCGGATVCRTSHARHGKLALLESSLPARLQADCAGPQRAGGFR